MSEESDRKPFSEADLDSVEYRGRLMRKLNCLIALLEVAMARVRRSLAAPEPDLDRLRRIRTNLQSTLDVCLRARAALERREALPLPLADALPELGGAVEREADALCGLQGVIRPRGHRMPGGARIEMSSSVEQHKFERLGRITPKEIDICNIEELARRLQS